MENRYEFPIQFAFGLVGGREFQLIWDEYRERKGDDLQHLIALENIARTIEPGRARFVTELRSGAPKDFIYQVIQTQIDMIVVARDRLIPAMMSDKRNAYQFPLAMFKHCVHAAQCLAFHESMPLFDALEKSRTDCVTPGWFEGIRAAMIELQKSMRVLPIWDDPTVNDALRNLAQATKALNFKARKKSIQDHMTNNDPHKVKARHPASILEDARKNGHGHLIERWFTEHDKGVLELHKEPKSEVRESKSDAKRSRKNCVKTA